MLPLTQVVKFRLFMADKFVFRETPGGTDPVHDKLQRARLALHNRRPHEAEQILGELLKTHPQDARPLNLFAYSLLMQNRAHDTIAVLEPAVRRFHDPELDTQLALALRQAGRNDDALLRLRRAAKRRPPFPPAFYELGCLLFSMKRNGEAVEALNLGLEAAPTPELSGQFGHVFLALRDYAGAKKAFARTLSFAATAPDALWGMGKAHQGTGENRAAIDYFRRCLAQMPNDTGSLLNLGYSLLEVGDLDAGHDCFRKAARGSETNYAGALATLVKSRRGRFWLKPSEAKSFLRGDVRKP